LRTAIAVLSLSALIAPLRQAVVAYLAFDAKITRVANTSSNNSSFSVLVTGGTGPCTNGGWISFPVSIAPDPDTHKRAYAAALLALTTGMSLRIHIYTNDDCHAATYIEIALQSPLWRRQLAPPRHFDGNAYYVHRRLGAYLGDSIVERREIGRQT
jgi:hypothetical protein